MLKEPPHSNEDERGVLGSILMDPDSMDRIDLRGEDFYDRRHQVLMDSLLEMRQSGKAMDAITIASWLKSAGNLDRVGGYDYLVELQDEVLVSAHIRDYASRVTHTAKLRSEIGILAAGLDKAYTGESVYDSVMGELSALDREEDHSITGIFSRWDSAQKGDIQTIPTPFPDFDRQTGGVRLGMPAVFTGQSGAGKSMFLSQWYNYLGQNNKPTLVFPFEDEYDVTITRMAANIGGYKWRKIENGGEWIFRNGQREWMPVQQSEVDKAKRCVEEVSKYPVCFYQGSIKPTELSGIVARYKHKHGILSFFVDGAKDFIKPTGKYNDVGFDEEASQCFKNTCKKHHVAGIAVHHLTKLRGEAISLDNIRGSGNIVSDSRIVYALQTDGILDANTDEYGKQTTRRLDCLKNNHGGLASMRLESDLDRCVFWKEN